MTERNPTAFSPDIERGIAAFATEHGVTRDEAIPRILRDWLIYAGYLPAAGPADLEPEVNAANGGGGGGVVVGGGG
jgi:hypothetical protein